jgi:eukaryotic-like serine/threonine-protein kinase
VRKLANFVLSDFQKSIQHLPGATPARELLVRTALEYLNNLSKDAPSNDPTFQWELSQAYEQVADVQGDLSGPNLGQFREALVSYNKALALVEPLANRSQSYDMLSCATWLYYKRGDVEMRTVNVASALRSYTEGLKLAERIDNTLHDSRTDDLFVNGYLRLANARTRLSAVKPALEDANRAAEAADRAALYRKDGGTANLARTRLLVGSLLWLRGDLQGAWSRYREAVAWLEQLIEAEPESMMHLQELQEAYRRCGDLQGNPSYFHFGDLEKAQLYHRKALRIAEQLAARDPNDAMARAELSVALRRMAAVVRGTQPAQAVELYREALVILQELIRRSPGDLSYQRDLANVHLGLATALRHTGKLRTSLEEVETALRMQHEMLDRNPERSVIQEDMFDSLLLLGDLKLQMRDVDAAHDGLTAALKRAESLSDNRKESLYSERCLAMVYQSFGDYYSYLASRTFGQSRAAHSASATAWYDKALGIWSRWRSHNLAVPFSTNREREVLRVKSASVLSSKL